MYLSSESQPTGFYEEALPLTERQLYRHARVTRGLDEEIALLRVRLFTLMEKRRMDGPSKDLPTNPMILRLIDMLVKAHRVQGSSVADQHAALEQLLDEEALKVLHSAQN